jgi:GT2 family glycosyltransferase
MSAPSTVAVVLLSYNRPHLLRPALASLRAQTWPGVSVLVVDNPSPKSEEIARLVTVEFPEFRLLRNPENNGYAGGMNTGLRAVKADLVYLTEDDIRMPPDGIEKLVLALEQRSPRSVIGGTVVADSDPEKVWSAGGRVMMGGGFRVAFAQERCVGVQPVEFISGNSLMARWDWLSELGGFREDFFMYLEDVELALRIRGAGGQVLMHGEVLIGDMGEGANMSARVNFHRLKNVSAVYLLHAPASVLPAFALRTLGWNNLSALWRDRGNLGPRLRALGWTLRNAARLWRERGAWHRRAQAYRATAPSA